MKMEQSGLLWRLAIPVMIAMLIQSIYNIADSYFIGKSSLESLTALSIIFPIQLLMQALSTGTGVGMNLLISRMDGEGSRGTETIMKCGFCAEIINTIVFTGLGLLLMRAYYSISSDNPIVCENGVAYARIILLFSLGMFIEAGATKILQARGNMILPMIAQIAGAVTNIVLDPLLIFGLRGFPKLGIRGAAIATVVGQWVAMAIVLFCLFRRESFLHAEVKWKTIERIYRNGFSSIIMQSLYTLYIVGLNLILKMFSEDAVTVLGIYYKLQTFFFIPLLGLQQAIVPIISYHYGAAQLDKAKEILYAALKFSVVIMAVGTVIFWLFPAQLLCIFSTDAGILDIGCLALRIIAVSFLPAAVTLIVTVFFQGVNRPKTSIWMTIWRQIFLFVPLAWLFHYFGLSFVWLTFPCTECIVAGMGMVWYRSWSRHACDGKEIVCHQNSSND